MTGSGFVVTVKFCAVDEPQELFAVTVISPPVPFAVARILFVVEVPFQPLGNVQVYEVAPFTLDTLKVFEELKQTELVPEIELGIDGIVFTATDKV